MIKPLESKHISEIAGVHIKALKGDFLPSLGNNFLETLYKGLIGQKDIYSFVDIQKGKVAGFIIGTGNIDLFLKTLLKANFLKLVFYLFFELLKKPRLIKNTLETFLYSKKDQGIKPELVVIAILETWQGKGIGKKLIRVLENKFKEEKIKKYKLTVHSNKKAVNFYNKLKFKKVSEFNLYNKLWYIYEKKIN